MIELPEIVWLVLHMDFALTIAWGTKKSVQRRCERDQARMAEIQAQATANRIRILEARFQAETQDLAIRLLTGR